MLTKFEVNNKVVSQTSQLLFETEPLEKTNPFLKNERYFINLLQQYKIIDKNINPTWRTKYLKEFMKSSSFEKKANIEEKLKQYDKWLNTKGIGIILE